MNSNAKRPVHALVIGNSHSVALKWAYDHLADAGAAREVRCERFRQQVDKLYMEECRHHHIQFVAAPRTMQDREGMLVEKAWNPDPTHGNSFYGYSLYEQLSTIAACRRSGVGCVAEAKACNG